MAGRPGLFDPCPCGSRLRFHACCKPLGAAARDPDQLVALAVGQHGAGQIVAAESLYRKALRLDPRQRDGLRNLAILLTDIGKATEAEALLRRCLEEDPDSPHGRFALGVALLRQRRLEEAAAEFRLAHAREPAHLPTLVNLGTTLAELGHRGEAIGMLEHALAIEPHNAETLLNLAILKSAAGEQAAALELGARALHSGGRSAPICHAIGLMALGAGGVEQAIDAFRKALETRPDFVDALVNLGSCLGDAGRPAEAVAYIERALAQDKQDAGLWCNLGLARLESGDLKSAVAAVGEAAKLAPENALVLGHQGLLAAVSGRLDEAQAHYRAALEIEPGSASYCIGLGTVLYESGDPEATAAVYEKFARAHPAVASIRFELAGILLQLGRWEQAWREYAYRAQARPRLALGMSLPTPAQLRGKRLVLRYEQGLGDHLFFLRFVPRLRALAQPSEVVFVASRPEMGSIAQRSPGVDRAVVGFEGDPGMLVADLPLWCALQGEASPAEPLPIAATGEARARAAQLLAQAGPGPYMAVTWEAGARDLNRLDRRLAFNPLQKRVDPRSLGEAVARWPGTILSLQRDPQAKDHAALEAGLGRRAVDLSGQNRDLETMLALLESIDEYAGVSNTNMHLRAAAGRGARVLVPRPYEWRWMYSGEASPWFPGFRVYREDREARWKPALARLREELPVSAPASRPAPAAG